MSTVTLSATAQAGKTLTNYLVMGNLPWGLYLDQTTGQISGTSADLKNAPNTVEVPKTPTPTWITPQGVLADVREGDTVTSSVSAQMVSGRTLANYRITKGMIAPGLFLDPSNGQITGTAAEIRLLNEPEYVDPGKNPTISQTVRINGTDTTVPSGGSLGTFAKNTSITIVFTPVIVSERTYSSLSITLGKLPWNLLLDQANYTLSGTIPTSTVAGTYTFTLKVVDSADAWTASTYTFNVQ